MAGKSLDEIWRQMQSQRQAEIGRQQAQERALYESRERARQEYLRNMRMYEKVGPVIPTSSAPGSGGGSRRISINSDLISIFSQSYIINWVDSDDDTWKISVFNFDTGILSETIDTELIYDDWNLYDNWRHIQEGGFSVVFQNSEDSSYKIFFLNVNGEVQGIKDLNTEEDFQYTENAQGYLGELNSVSTFYHFVNEGVNTHQFPGDVNNIEINEASEDDVTKDGSMIVEYKNENKYWISRPNGDLVDITSLLGGESNYRIDYNTDFIFSRFSGTSVKVISQEGVLRNEINLTEFGSLSINTSTLFGENCAYYNFLISGEDLKLMVVYDGDFNRFVTSTYSNSNSNYRVYTERSWIDPYSSFGKTVVVSSWEESSSNDIGSITDRVELKWLPKGKEEFYTQIIEGDNLVFILGDDDINSSRTFTHGENPIVMFADEGEDINVGYLTNDGFFSQSTGILASSCSNIYGHNIGEKSFAVFDIDVEGGDPDYRIWQIYGDSLEFEAVTTVNWDWGSGRRYTNRNGTLAIIDSGDINSLVVPENLQGVPIGSFYYTPGYGIQSLPVNNGNIYNERTHGNRTGISSDSQLITKIDESSNLEGFYLLTRLGLSDFVELSLDSNYEIGNVVIGDNIISISFNNSQSESNKVIVYNKSNLQLIHDTEDIQANNIEQYSDRTLVEITDGEETELILIHKNGVETLSINQKYLSYESNDSYDND
jgi:hypothetical protein